MKTWIIMLSLACSSLTYAKSNATVRNIIVNNASYAINYELNDPMGSVYRGALTPGQIKIIYLNDLSDKLYGTYALFTNTCHGSWFTRTCSTKHNVLFVKQDEDIIWTYTTKEITTTEMALSQYSLATNAG